MRGNNRKGFTLVEAVIVIVVIAVILAVTIPWMRERERARLQALADNEPWEVFGFRAKPAKAAEKQKKQDDKTKAEQRKRDQIAADEKAALEKKVAAQEKELVDIRDAAKADDVTEPEPVTVPDASAPKPSFEASMGYVTAIKVLNQAAKDAVHAVNDKDMPGDIDDQRQRLYAISRDTGELVKAAPEHDM